MINRVLQLTRPLTMFDVESTGSNPDQDRIIQLSITMHYSEKDPVRWVSDINPGVLVPPEIQKIHGITDARLAEAPTFKSIAAEIVRKTLTNVDFAGHGVMFDLRMIRAECRRAGLDWDWEKTDSAVIDTLRIRQITRPNDLKTVYAEITGKTLDNAHDAGADVAATEEVLLGLLALYPHIPRTPAKLSEFCWPKKADAVDRAGKFVWRHHEACIGFGKFNGTPLKDVDAGYLRWMLKGDFPPDTKAIAEDALNGIYPKRDA